jgi:diguanylate cyclase (GGDEF)-like protein/PAS domain S-box-containing protein
MRIRRLRPFESGARWILPAILATLLAVAAISVTLTLSGTGRASDRAAALETQLWVAIGGLLAALALAGGLILTYRRQSAQLRALARSSTDLLALVDELGCRYASPSLIAKTGRPEADLLGAGLAALVHEDDRPLLAEVAATAQPGAVSFRLQDVTGEWRHLDARVTDLRGDRHLRGVVIDARDGTERYRLEQELTHKAAHDGYVSMLAEALEMADEEPAVCDVVERAMAEISEATPMELLLSDSSRANLRSVADSPTAGAPGCGVKSPFSCVAVRRGSAVVFESSEELNACPHLRGRPGGACSAVCVPVGFMGGSLGVLHTTGPEHTVLEAERVARLRSLAAQSGSRIGTVRAFEKTQLQASTDGLTGLVNRRTAEARLREMIKDGKLFAVVLADLDHFKQLNDTHGHEAGDRALRLFASVAQEALRDHDVVSRWGGEEFIIVLPELDRTQAGAVIDRLRVTLGAAHNGETPIFTASFGISDSNQSASIEELVAIADVGLYAAKNAGRDCAMVGEADGPSPAPRRADPQAAGRDPRPPIQEASYEEEPAPSGAQIR